MKRKQQFLNAVQILAPGDQLILKAAQRVPEESLPVAPGGVALEFVVSMQRLITPAGREVLGSTANEDNGALPKRDHLSMRHALRIQSAKYWLELGEPDEALRELEALPTRAWNHPLAIKTRVAAIRVAREIGEVTVQE